MISVIIPVYNEEEALPHLYERLIKVLDSLNDEYECLFINDGSTDNSHKILKNFDSQNKNVRIFNFRRNFGQTQAIACGFDYAKGDIIITMDADLQNPPEDIPLLIEKIKEGYDVVSGWRKNRKDPLFSKKLPSFIANKFISWTTGIRLKDFGCTLKAYRKWVIKGLKLYGEMHRFLPVLCQWKGAKIVEIPVRHERRKYGETKYGTSRVFKVILDIFVLRFFLSVRNTPMHLIGGWGIITLFLSLISGVATILLKILKNIDMTGDPLLYLTILLGILGFQFMILGLLGEINMRNYYEASGNKLYQLKDDR